MLCYYNKVLSLLQPLESAMRAILISFLAYLGALGDESLLRSPFSDGPSDTGELTTLPQGRREFLSPEWKLGLYLEKKNVQLFRIFPARLMEPRLSLLFSLSRIRIQIGVAHLMERGCFFVPVSSQQELDEMLCLAEVLLLPRIRKKEIPL